MWGNAKEFTVSRVQLGNYCAVLAVPAMLAQYWLSVSSRLGTIKFLSVCLLKVFF